MVDLVLDLLELHRGIRSLDNALAYSFMPSIMVVNSVVCEDPHYEMRPISNTRSKPPTRGRLNLGSDAQVSLFSASNA